MDFTGHISQDLYRAIEDERSREWCRGRWRRAWQQSKDGETIVSRTDQRLPECEPERRAPVARTPRIA